ncbi:acetyltransferase [Planotetraspora silvatica]|uniref:Acetyltransferase n=1 Tax=Planotetraspora silvatica TaxID=234614 RepID=A0A8J3XRJ4_9ACTN|nr:GNAT family protein [Planotetraspora silvatica]GII50270.1 acetyltransferase [Planotetraspora silvatica]
MTDQLDFSHKPTLHGDLVDLRPVRAGDALILNVELDDPEVAVLTGSVNSRTAPAPAYEADELERIYQAWSTARDRMVWVVLERSTCRIIGEAVLNDLDSANRWCNYRIWLAARGRGYGTEATRLVLDYAFEVVGLNRVELEVFDFNPRARRVYEKAGFRHEGTRRQALLMDGEWVDAHVMSVIAADRKPRRQVP